eukprot:SAG11_NODE_2403_length_3399_cov_2.326364_2_plen_77_part_00
MYIVRNNVGVTMRGERHVQSDDSTATPLHASFAAHFDVVGEESWLERTGRSLLRCVQLKWWTQLLVLLVLYVSMLE